MQASANRKARVSRQLQRGPELNTSIDSDAGGRRNRARTVTISTQGVPSVSRGGPTTNGWASFFGAKLLKGPRRRSGPNPLKSATGGRPARGRPAAPPQKGPRSSGRAKPLKPVPGEPPQKGPRSGGGPKAAKVASSGRFAKRSWLRRRGKAAEGAGLPLGGRAKLLKSQRLLMSTVGPPCAAPPFAH